MTSLTLREARAYEEMAEKSIPAGTRPAFHLSPRTGWMNDPNGFSRYGGRYHLFYQHYPYATEWGTMHWGHAVSDDLLHWEYLPAALAPDEAYDCAGCFSGSAAELPDGRQLLMYTGVSRERTDGEETSEIQTQCLAVGDGVDYEKYSGNPVLTSADLPPGASRVDFRDPKIRVRDDGSWDAYVGSRAADGSGQILLFRSADGFRWHFEKVLAENRNRLGKMWECPDFFELDGKWVLLASPQEMCPEGLKYPGGYGTICLIGSCSEDTMEFREESDQAVDYGIDFYAPQTALTPDGRRVMIGWMQNWGTVSPPRENRLPWYGQMSIPRELSVKNGRLYQVPIRELESLRGERAEHAEESFSGTVSYPDVSGRLADLEVDVEPAEEGGTYGCFSVRLAKDSRSHTSVSFRPGENVLELDRGFSGSRGDAIRQRRARVSADRGKLNLRIIMDRYSAEVFVNGGEQVLTATLLTDEAADGIEFIADGNVRMRVVNYTLDI